VHVAYKNANTVAFHTAFMKKNPNIFISIKRL